MYTKLRLNQVEFTDTGSFSGSFSGSFVGSGANLTGITATNATNATNTAITDTTSGTGPYYITFTSTTTGNTGQLVDSTGLTYNATSNTITATSSYANQALSSSNSATSSNSLNLNGQQSSFYLNASNINAGTLNNSYLPTSINVNSVTASFTGSFTGAGLLVPYTFGGTGVAALGASTPGLRVMNNCTTVNVSLLANTAPNIAGFSVDLEKSTDSGSIYSPIISITLPDSSKMIQSSSIVALSVGDVIRATITANQTAANWSFQINTKTV